MALFNTQSTWGGVAKFFHWTIGFLVIGLLIVGLIMEKMDFSPLKFQIYAVHKATGIIVFSLVILRIIWLSVNRRPKELESYTRLEHSIANLVHILLYIGLIGMPLSGWIMSSAANFPVNIFGLFTMPNLVAPNEDLAELMGQIHMLCGYALIAATGLHIAGALKHHVIDKDITLRRMLPAYGSGMAIIMALALMTFLGSAQLAQTPQASSDMVEDTPLVTEDEAVRGEDMLFSDVPAWTILPEESSLTFTARQQGSEFTGRFGSFSGEILFEPAHLEASRISITIDVSDVTTGAAERDEQMTGPLWFAVDEHPTALFKSTEIIGGQGGENSYIAKGKLTLKGITHDLDLPFTLTFPEGGKAHAIGRVTLRRLDYRIGEEQWQDTASIGNEVLISVDINAIIQE